MMTRKDRQVNGSIWGFVGIFVFIMAILTLLVSENYAQSGTPIKIGFITPVTGPVSYDGSMLLEGIKIIDKEISAQGGVLGRPMNIVIEDGKGDPIESVSAAEKLMTRDKVTVLMGAWASSASLAVMPIAEKYGVPFIVETSSSPKITEPSSPGFKWTFRPKSTAGIDGELVAAQLKDLKLTKLAFLSQNNDWGRSVAKSYSESAMKKGIPTVLSEFFTLGERNFNSFLTKIKASEATGLIITASYDESLLINEQFHELRMKIPRMISSGLNAGKFIRLAGPGRLAPLESVYFVDYFAPAEGSASFNSFLKEYQNMFGKDKYPEHYSVMAYVSTKIIRDAIAKAGGTDPEKIREVLENNVFDTLFGKLKFGREHQATPAVFLTQIKNGKQVVVKRMGGF